LKIQNLWVAVMLFAVSLLVIAPSMTHVVAQSGMVTITASGSASPTGTNETALTSARVYLTGWGSDDNGTISLSIITGVLQIGPTFYSVVSGQGQASPGSIQLSMQASGAISGPLTLQGTLQGDNVAFSAGQSTFASQYALLLYGQLLINPSSMSVAPMATTSSTSMMMTSSTSMMSSSMTNSTMMSASTSMNSTASMTSSAAMSNSTSASASTSS